MKSLLAIIIIMASFTSQAGWIESDYLYGLSKRHFDYVDNSGEFTVDSEYENHGKWVDTKHIIEDHKWIGYLNHTVIDMHEDNRWEDVNDYLFGGEVAFCEALVVDFWHTYDEETCKFAVQELLGDALDKADAGQIVIMSGDYYGDWEKVLIILSDYETKETITLNFDALHEV